MKSIRQITFFFAFGLGLTHCFAQQPEFTRIESNTKSSFRALSVVDDLVAWVSGSNGWYGRTRDGGKNWEFDQFKLYKDVDFRAVYAFDYFNAIVVSAGSPAYVLKTTDGGQNWIPVYQNSNPDIFLDGMDFWNLTEGVIYGDPIDGKMTLLRTQDGGFSWQEFQDEKRPDMKVGEASFAASGTGIRCYDSKNIIISTGGSASRLFLSNDKGESWKDISVPIIQGQSSEGIYSVAISEQNIWVVGGDYSKEEARIDHVFYSINGGRSWKKPASPTLGYRECVEYLDENALITTGPSGTEISIDGGLNWTSAQERQGMHVVRKARNGNLIVMAGREGILYLVK